MLSKYCQTKLAELEAVGLLRHLKKLNIHGTRHLEFNGKKFLNFSSNDYLGLSTHPHLKKTFNTLMDLPIGATASRLITGNHPSYEVLENTIASFKRTESALVFTSGYAAAIGTIPALVGKNDFVVMDKLCHACLVDGARLSGATIRVFPHNHLRRCETLLESCRRKGGDRGKILLMTESIFSMDGDLAPLDELAQLKKKYEAWLMVDEAHATGILGENGRGGAEYFGVEDEVDISMGTLSKALGCMGGFICGSRPLKEFLINQARSLIFSTGLPPFICQAGATAISLIQKEPHLRKKLWKNVDFFRKQFIRDDAFKQNQPILSPIIPIMIGKEKRCLKVAQHLQEKGILASAIRYPTVGRGKARLRVSISAAHTEEDILCLSEALKQNATSQTTQTHLDKVESMRM